MTDWFRRLLEPVPTSPTDSFRWRDPRPVRKQIASGFRIAGGLIAGFVILGAIFKGLAWTSEGEGAIGWVVLLFAAVLMFVTANRWARFIPGFFGLVLARTLLPMLVWPNKYLSPLSRSAAVAIWLIALTGVVLTWRFVDGCPANTTFLDRLALTFVVFTLVEQTVVPYHFPPWSLIWGAGGLLAAWCWYHRTRRRHKRRHCGASTANLINTEDGDESKPL